MANLYMQKISELKDVRNQLLGEYSKVISDVACSDSISDKEDIMDLLGQIRELLNSLFDHKEEVIRLNDVIQQVYNMTKDAKYGEVDPIIYDVFNLVKREIDYDQDTEESD